MSRFHTERHQPLASHAASRESGSAYIIALMLLVVLTVLGLGLALITQTEMQMGANERTMQRIFYAADSGISYSLSATVNNFDCDAKTFKLGDLDLGTASRISLAPKEEVDVSVLLPVFSPPCTLCGINNAGGSQGYGGDTAYFNVNHAVTAQAIRQFGSAATSHGQAEVGAFVSLQPWPQLKDCFANLGTPAAAKVKM